MQKVMVLFATESLSLLTFTLPWPNSVSLTYHLLKKLQAVASHRCSAIQISPSQHGMEARYRKYFGQLMTGWGNRSWDEAFAHINGDIQNGMKVRLEENCITALKIRMSFTILLPNQLQELQESWNNFIITSKRRPEEGHRQVRSTLLGSNNC